MKILTTTDTQILFFGRTGYAGQTVDVFIRDEQDNTVVINDTATLNTSGNFNTITITNNFEEGKYYELVISKNDVTIYRNKIFVADSDYAYNSGQYETNTTDNDYITL